MPVQGAQPYRQWADVRGVARDSGTLRGERYGTSAAERGGEPGEDAEVGVKLDAGQATDAERGERELMLEPSELALHGHAAVVQALPLGRAVGDLGQR